MKHGNPTLDEVRLAFGKLQTHVYFDNYDLFLRRKVARYKKTINKNIYNFVAQFSLKNPFAELLKNDVKLTFMPKKVVTQHSELPDNFYTNTRIIDKNEILKPNVHCNFPVEFHLIATIWIMRYGAAVEKNMSKNSYGNRLIINSDNKEIEGRSLFKLYHQQFQNWWSLAIRKTKEWLDKGENVTIVNFDLQSFYHEVSFNFDELEGYLMTEFPQIKNDIVHKLIKQIHLEYKQVLKTVKPNLIIHDNRFPLPIGLFTSHVFANHHLKKLDLFISREVKPIYYGRYVDDFLIVVKNTVLEQETIKKGLDADNPDEIVRLYLKEYFPKLFNIPKYPKQIEFKIPSLRDLKLNMDKLFIYQFDKEHSPNLIEKFVEDQKERSSMFRFLSDEEDEYFDDFDNQTFESNFDHVDANKARFKNLEDNKYKLSSFLSKLIRRRIQKGEGYKEEEITKIDKYFKGPYLIKHYYFWEKLFTLYVVYQKPKLLANLVENIQYEINLIKVGKHTDFKVNIADYRKHLKVFLNHSLSMALGLNINFILESDDLKAVLIKHLSNSEKTNAQKNSTEDYLKKKYIVFKASGLLRGAFVYYPLLQFTKLALNNDIDLTNSDSIFHATKKSNNPYDYFGISNQGYIPFRVKFWQTSLLIYYKNLFASKRNLRGKTWHNDQFSSYELLDKAFDLFYSINKPSIAKSILKPKYFNAYKTDKKSGGTIVFPKERSNNYYIQELQLSESGETKETYRIGIVNKYVDSADFTKSLEGNPDNSPDRMEIFDQIWDEVSKIHKCDMFVMPELSLPHKLISRYTDQSARKQVAYVSGIEHLNIYNIGFNFIITVLPVIVNGDRDAIPVLRLKNHYAPEEEEFIKKDKKMSVPKPKPYRYDLFEWRGLYFSSYYCYELADVFHRSIFFSKVDAIIAPVWNIDTHYYNSIIDAATRDMHNYFILVNTSQYGFSKISRPRDHINKEKIFVKGGTEEEYSFTILVGDLKVRELREFQLLDFAEQKEANTNKKSFKPTPPDFPIENVEKRINNETFYPD